MLQPEPLLLLPALERAVLLQAEAEPLERATLSADALATPGELPLLRALAGVDAVRGAPGSGRPTRRTGYNGPTNEPNAPGSRVLNWRS